MLTETSESIKIGKKTRENFPSNDSGIQMDIMLYPPQESSGIIDDNDEEGTDSEKDVFLKKEETDV